MLALTFKGLLRRKVSCLLFTLLVCIGAIGMHILSGILENQEDALEKIYDESKILCVISNLRGTKTDGLQIVSAYIDLCLTDEKYDFCTRIEKVCLKRTVVCHMEALQEDVSLIGITYTDGVDELLPQNGVVIQFLENYTYENLLGNEVFCIVPYAMLPLLVEDGDGRLQAALTMEETTITLPVGGIYTGGDARTIYCPFRYVASLLTEDKIYTESLSFYVKDARSLESFREESLKYFSEPKFTAEDADMYFAMIVHDDLFQVTVSSVKENIFMLRLLIPVLYIISAGVGFLASFLFMRGRKREFAVMRSLGMHRAQVIGVIFLEQFILCIVSTLFGTVLLQTLRSRMPDGGIVGGCLFTLCYLGGVLTATIWITNVTVMKLLKTED